MPKRNVRYRRTFSLLYRAVPQCTCVLLQGNLPDHLYKPRLLPFRNLFLFSNFNQAIQSTPTTKYQTPLLQQGKMVRAFTFTILAAVLLAATTTAAPAKQKMRAVSSVEMIERDGGLIKRQSYCGLRDNEGTCCCSVCDCLLECICDLICGEIDGCAN